MNTVVLIGRLTKDPNVRYSQDGKPSARYTLAVDRPFKSDSADFINCVAFGNNAEFTNKYFRKGMKVAVAGRLQTGSYQKEGQTVYTTDVVIDRQEFVESKGEARVETKADVDGFIDVPKGIDEELPFN